MNKKILITGWVVICGIVVALIATGSFGELASLAIRQRVVPPPKDISYVSCNKYESIETGYSTLYLVSSKKTYATVNNESIDVSDEINLRYFQKQQIALWQADPKKISAIIDYSSGDKFVMQSNFYINGTPITCPSVIIGTMGWEWAEPLPECDKWIQTLQGSGLTATCLGRQKFSLQVSDVSLLSSLGEIFPIIPKSFAYTLSPSTTEIPPTSYSSKTTYSPYTTEPYNTENPTTSEIPYTTDEPSTTEPPTTYSSDKKTKTEWRCANGKDYEFAMPKPCGCKNGWNGAKSTAGTEEWEKEWVYIKTITVSCPEDKLKPKWKIVTGLTDWLTENDLREIKEHVDRGGKTWDILKDMNNRIGIKIEF